ncbi:MAG: hypothetical protein KDI69_10395 [Xanthomonadales bacterium]|nr:hypothetical protein [Xanthomonadales bacterium]
MTADDLSVVLMSDGSRLRAAELADVELAFANTPSASNTSTTLDRSKPTVS